MGIYLIFTPDIGSWLEINYDIFYSMTAFIGLVPKEFEGWKIAHIHTKGDFTWPPM